MTAAVFLSYWTGLRFVAPDLDPAALVGTALALHVCHAIMCRLFAHNNGYPKDSCSAGVKMRALKPSPVGRSSARRMRAMSQTSTPIPTTTARSARPAGVASRRVAGRRLDLDEGLSPLGGEVTLVHRVIDEVPRQHRVERIRPMDEAIGVNGLAPAAAEPPERRPPGVGLGCQTLEDRRRAPVAAREQRLEIRLARA